VTYRIVKRTEYGLPAAVTKSDGSLRPLLSKCKWITAHYTGVNIKYADRSTPETILQIQNVFAATKPFEYNYVIGQEADDCVYEYAGKFQAAHSAGENSEAVGVLFLVGTSETVTERMIDKWRWLRDRLRNESLLQPDVIQAMHYQMPGAQTSCPGDSIKSQWNKFLLPYNPPTPVNPDNGETVVIAYFAKPPKELPNNPPWLVCINGSVRYMTNFDAQQAPDLPVYVLNKDQYGHLLKGANLA
jgi:hypothetical protein